jgi:tRNA threonylcarbamoyladenosine biosynthesis protein TsaB
MRIIGIDTATTAASVALVDNGIVIAEKSHPTREPVGNGERHHGKSNHAETILPLLESLLQSTGMSLHDVDGLALSIGPGSFTGLRIGLSTVKGLAYGSQLPVVGVSTLLAHAARVTNYDGLICTLLDARKNEIYAALFQKAGDAVHRLSEDSVASAARLLEIIRPLARGASCLMVGDGAALYKQWLLQELGVGALFQAGDFSLSIGAAVARLSEHRFLSNDVDNLGSLTPVYLSRCEAELKPAVFVQQLNSMRGNLH